MKYKKAAALGMGLLLFIADVRTERNLKLASKITQDKTSIFIVRVIKQKPLRLQKRIEMKLKKL